MYHAIRSIAVFACALTVLTSTGLAQTGRFGELADGPYEEITIREEPRQRVHDRPSGRSMAVQQHGLRHAR